MRIEREEQSTQAAEQLPRAHDPGEAPARVQAGPNGRSGPISQLATLAGRHGLPSLQADLNALLPVLALDLSRIEAALAGVRRPERMVGKSAALLLDLEGKRLRPLLVVLAARLGPTFSAEHAVDLAVAVELVHSATLLHDDVVDLGTLRRGAKTSRVVYGNAASIFAGDWLLVEALRRVRSTELGVVLDGLLKVIEEMILAESEQLERRGRLEPDRGAYERIIEGKTASLFGWAVRAGGASAGLSGDALPALERFGRGLGRAFQLVDDALDLAGDERELRKALAADLREGKLTYPLIVGLERRPELGRVFAEVLQQEEGPELAEHLRRRVLDDLAATRALEATEERARAEIEGALGELAALPDSGARRVLEALARATVERRS